VSHGWRRVGDPREKGEEGEAKKLYLLRPFQRCFNRLVELKDISEFNPISYLIQFRRLRRTYLLAVQ
jgi:hypothetical protein